MVCMRKFSAWLAAALLCAPSFAAARTPLTCDVSRHQASSGVAASASPDRLALSWRGTDDQPISLRLSLMDGAPRIDELAVGDVAVARDAGVEYRLVTGLRRISRQQMRPLQDLGVPITAKEVDEHKWDAFWDAPLDLHRPPTGEEGRRFNANQPPVEGVAGQPGLPRSPHEIAHVQARVAATSCAVVSDGARVSVSYSGAVAGVFSGELVLTVFRGTNLIRVELVASTSEPSVAYKYDAGLTGLAIAPGASVAWRDTANNSQRYGLGGKPNDSLVPIFAANRLIVAETGRGAIAAFPPPHTFFWAREIEANVGNNWYRKAADGTFGVGVRQAEEEIVEEFRENWALYSAPPGSLQRMAFYIYPAAGDGARAFEGALAFTRNDRFKALAGYKVMAHHFHTGMGERILKSGSLDTRLRDFEAFKTAGVDIVGVTDIFPAQRNAGGPKRLEVMKAYFEAAQRTSDEAFLVMPNVEATNILGGHWDVLLSKPTLWMETREAGKPFLEDVPGVGPVYNLGSPADAMRMVEEADMLIYMPHPRTKGSTHFPDAIADSPAFNSDRYRGAGWRWGMGSDLSERRLSEKRVLPLFDEMNNWIADTALKPKYLISITETFDKNPGDDIYANGPVNYLKLDKTPTGDDYRPVISALNAGDYFVTSGEVLITNPVLHAEGERSSFSADVQWTYPLDFIEVVWGDGKTTHRKVVSTTDQGAFGAQRFVVPFDATRAKWARLAAWDAAGNGAIVQPQRLGKRP